MNTPFYKQPTEKYAISMNYTDELSTGETIASTSIKAYTIVGNTDVTTTIIDTTSTTTTTALCVVKAGTSGTKYKITFVSTTSLGYILEDDIYMTVLDE